MHKNTPYLLTINSGSSSIKFALFNISGELTRVLEGKIEGIGSTHTTFSVKNQTIAPSFNRPVVAKDFAAAVTLFLAWFDTLMLKDNLKAIGHRLVHGGAHFFKPVILTKNMTSELAKLIPLDPIHLPSALNLIHTFGDRFPALTQIACFDTAFHHNLPQVAKVLPIARKYFEKGVRRYGFHGLACEFVMQTLRATASAKACKQVVIAHLGNGASISAVNNGRSIDTTMGFTPAGGIPMSTRSGNIDPGIFAYLASTENITINDFHRMMNYESGLLGVSQTSGDVRELLLHEKKDARTADAIALFCYEIKKSICAMAGALGGITTFVFSGGIGENLALIRERIFRELDFLGLELDEHLNSNHAAIISSKKSRVSIRIIRTDEALIIAQNAYTVLGLTKN